MNLKYRNLLEHRLFFICTFYFLLNNLIYSQEKNGFHENENIKLFYSNATFSISEFIMLENHIVIYSLFQHKFILIDKNTNLILSELDLTKIDGLKISTFPFHFIDGSETTLKTPFSFISKFKLYSENDSTINVSTTKYNGHKCLMSLSIEQNTMVPKFNKILLKNKFDTKRIKKIEHSKFFERMDLFFNFNDYNVFSFSLELPLELKNSNENQYNRNGLLAISNNTDSLYCLYYQCDFDMPLERGNTILKTDSFLLFIASQNDTLIFWDKNLKFRFGKSLQEFITMENNDCIVFKHIIKNQKNNEYYLLITNIKPLNIQDIQFKYYLYKMNINYNQKMISFENILNINSNIALEIAEQIVDNKLFLISNLNDFKETISNIYFIDLNNLPKERKINIKKKKNSNKIILNPQKQKVQQLDSESRDSLFGTVLLNTDAFPQNSAENLIKSMQKCTDTQQFGYFFSYLVLFDSTLYQSEVLSLKTQVGISDLWKEKLQGLYENFNTNELKYSSERECWEVQVNNTLFSLYCLDGKWYFLLSYIIFH